MIRYIRSLKVLFFVVIIIILIYLFMKKELNKSTKEVLKIYSTEPHKSTKEELKIDSTEPHKSTKEVLKIDSSIDYGKVKRKPIFKHLQQSIHFTKLQSTFNCSDQHIMLLVLIKSHPINAHRRESIRKTWGKNGNKEKNNNFRKFFLMGNADNDKVKAESQKNSDIVLGNFIDNFYNLSLKAEMGFEWSYKHCSFEYLLETDDDVFINIPLILSKIRQKQFPSRDVYLGRSKFKDPPVRPGEVSSGEKYIVTIQEYAGRLYPPYCSGGAYIFSSDVIAKILPFINQNQFKLDDVYIGMLVYNAQVKVTHFEGFNLVEHECNLGNNALAHHQAKDIKCMMKLYLQMLLMNIGNEDVQKHYLGDYML